MDIYEQIQARITAVSHISVWPDTVSILDHSAQQQPKNWRLPAITCQAVGGTQTKALPAMSALACLQISILLLDDLLDADPRGEYHRLGMPAAANAAAAFQAAGLEIVAQSNYPQPAQFAIITALNQMVLTTAYGQYLDSQSLNDEETYWQQVALKSGPFFGTAFQIGALAAGADRETAAKLRQLGLLYGRLIQIHDDLGDTMAQPATPDWQWERPSLPILFARLVPHSERKRFQQLFEAIPEEAALTEAQEILIRSGAVSYCLHQITVGYQEAETLLANINLNDKTKLVTLLEEVIAPVQSWFASLSSPP